MKTGAFDWPSLPPSPEVQIDRRQAGEQSADDDKIIVAHFEPATQAHSRYRLAKLGVTSDYHVQELATSALLWLATDDFAGYDRAQGRFRLFLRGVIDNMAFHLRRSLTRGILPRSIREPFEYYYRQLRDDALPRLTPQLAPEENHGINLDVLVTYMASDATPQEMEFVEVLFDICQDPQFDPRSQSIAKALAAVTGWSEDNVRKIKSRLRLELMPRRDHCLRQALD